MEKAQYLLGSVIKVLERLDLLSHHNRLSLAELSRLSGVDKTAAFRSMYTLEKYGYVEKLPGTSYRLGIKFLYYGNLVSIRRDVVALVWPFLQQLAIECKLAAHLGSLHGDRVVTIHKEESPYDL